MPLVLPYHAVKRADIRSGEFVGIFGVGPLGQMAVLCAKSFSGRVVAVDLNDQRLVSAREFGAEFTVNPKDSDPYKKIRTITNEKGIERPLIENSHQHSNKCPEGQGKACSGRSLS